jgi:hypothetical protein
MGGDCVWTWTHTTESCAAQPPKEDLAKGELCITGNTSGMQYCKSDADTKGKNCGFINDDFVCIGNVNQDGCAKLGDGAVVCGSKAPTPPAPDSGTPGVKASPDETIEQTDASGNTTTLNYYSNTTVANSARDTGSGDNPFDGKDDGSGEDGDGEQGDGLSCEAENDEECHGGGEGDGEEDVSKYWSCWSDNSESLQSAIIGCAVSAWTYVQTHVYEESDTLKLVNELADSVPVGGACPSASFVAWGESYNVMEVACDLLEDQAPVISGLFMLFWSFLGLRILMSAHGG